MALTEEQKRILEEKAVALNALLEGRNIDEVIIASNDLGQKAIQLVKDILSDVFDGV